MSFPECHHAGREIEPGLRDCHAPQLVGLRIVSPPMCAGCVYRESRPTIDEQESVSLPDLFPCALRGEPSGQNDEVIFACRHPRHEYATPAVCRECPDYLFPQMAPELPTEIAARLLPVLNPQFQTHGWWLQENAQRAFRRAANELIRDIPSYPGSFRGRGIVIAGGGKYFVSAYVTVRVLRHVGCTLPIELWHLAGEIDDRQRALLAPYGVTCHDAQAHAAGADFPWHATWWKGWQLKPFAIRHCSFREVLYLDADCYPVRDPSDLFDGRGYVEHGAVIFPDLEETKGLLPAAAPAIFGVPDFTDHPSESGQMVINKERCWRELQLALHYNRLAEFSYRHLWGDKDTFPIAWKRLGREYARLWPTASRMTHAKGILHYDQAGRVLFQHRCGDKFRLSEVQFDSNLQETSSPCYHPDLALEDFCFAALNDLRSAHAGSPESTTATAVETGTLRGGEADTNGERILSPKIAPHWMTNHRSIQEMYPPVAVEMLTSSEWQQKFKEQFLDSGDFSTDPFEIADSCTRAQTKCFSVSLFQQNVDNHRPHELPADAENWERKYWRGLLGLVRELPAFPEWKLRIYVEDSLWEMVRHELSAHSQIELFHMNADSVGASPGMLWRFMALGDDSLDLVLVTDIDEPLGPKIDFIRSFEMDRRSSLARINGFLSDRDYLVAPGESLARNYATIQGGLVMSRPKRLGFDVSGAIRGFMAHRKTQASSARPWAYDGRELPSAYNTPVQRHIFGWGSHWYMYGFDERFLKHVLYYHFAEKGELHTWAPSPPPSQLSPEWISDLVYVQSKGNPTIPPHMQFA